MLLETVKMILYLATMLVLSLPQLPLCLTPVAFAETAASKILYVKNANFTRVFCVFCVCIGHKAGGEGARLSGVSVSNESKPLFFKGLPGLEFGNSRKKNRLLTQLYVRVI